MPFDIKLSLHTLLIPVGTLMICNNETRCVTLSLNYNIRIKNLKDVREAYLALVQLSS